MADIDHKVIRQGLRTILLTVPGLPTNKSWENREFTPPTNTAWIRETLLPSDEGVSASDTITAIGTMQYDVFWPFGGGTEDAETLADAIKNTFKPDTTITSNAYTYRAERLAGRVDENWYIIPVRLTYRAHAIG